MALLANKSSYNLHLCCVFLSPSRFSLSPGQAKLVATATSNLCDAANLVVKSNADKDKLIAVAKAVAAHTAQLLLACQVKANPRSVNNRHLQVSQLYLYKDHTHHFPHFSLLLLLLLSSTLSSPSLPPPPPPPFISGGRDRSQKGHRSSCEGC